jgi:hypothetical protein
MSAQVDDMAADDSSLRGAIDGCCVSLGLAYQKGREESVEWRSQVGAKEQRSRVASGP